jgi:O-antigen/teichoic acid export membrane protein
MKVSCLDLQEHGRRVTNLRYSPTFLKSASNARYSVADYLAQPLLLLAATPLLVAHLGLDQYGIWMLALALTGSMGVLSVGFGDATIKFVATYRGRDDLTAVTRVAGAAVTINAVLGALMAALVVGIAPALVRHVFKIIPTQYTMATHAIQLGGGVLFFRSVDSVFVSILRAYEHYGPSVRVAVLTKVLAVIFSVGLVLVGCGVVAIMALTVGTAALGAGLQCATIRRMVPELTLLPTLDRSAYREMASFGLYTWIQGVASLIFSHADRLLIGSFLGTTAVAYYTICVQAAQPIHGVMAAGFNFLFPHLSVRHGAGDRLGSKRVFRLATIVNLVCTIALCFPLIFFARKILTLWMGSNFANQSHSLLAILVIAFGLLSVNVVPHYTLLALGQARYVSLLNVAGGAVSLIASVFLIPAFGPLGAALGRLLYGPVIALNYVRVAKSL